MRSKFDSTQILRSLIYYVLHLNLSVSFIAFNYFFVLKLEEHIQRLREELDREREERNYFQLERDKVNTFWEITKRQHDEKKAELRNKDREMEDAEERHQIEIKVGLLVH